MRSGLPPPLRPELAAFLAMAALCACEAREPPTHSLAAQTWTDKAPDDPGLAGGPKRMAAAHSVNGFVLVGGPPTGAAAQTYADGAGSGFQMTSGTTGADMALHSVVYADDAGFAGGPRPRMW